MQLIFNILVYSLFLQLVELFLVSLSPLLLYVYSLNAKSKEKKPNKYLRWWWRGAWEKVVLYGKQDKPIPCGFIIRGDFAMYCTTLEGS